MVEQTLCAKSLSRVLYSVGTILHAKNAACGTLLSEANSDWREDWATVSCSFMGINKLIGIGDDGPINRPLRAVGGLAVGPDLSWAPPIMIFNNQVRPAERLWPCHAGRSEASRCAPDA